jgi:hypothetical protein
MTVRYMTAAGDTVRNSRFTRQPMFKNTTYEFEVEVHFFVGTILVSTATPVLVLPQVLPPFFTVCYGGCLREAPDRGKSGGGIGFAGTAQSHHVSKTATLAKGQVHDRMNISQVVHAVMIVDPTAKPNFKGGQIRRGKERVHRQHDVGGKRETVEVDLGPDHHEGLECRGRR